MPKNGIHLMRLHIKAHCGNANLPHSGAEDSFISYIHMRIQSPPLHTHVDLPTYPYTQRIYLHYLCIKLERRGKKSRNSKCKHCLRSMVQIAYLTLTLHMELKCLNVLYPPEQQEGPLETTNPSMSSFTYNSLVHSKLEGTAGICFRTCHHVFLGEHSSIYSNHHLKIPTLGIKIWL